MTMTKQVIVHVSFNNHTTIVLKSLTGNSVWQVYVNCRQWWYYFDVFPVFYLITRYIICVHVSWAWII